MVGGWLRRMCSVGGVRMLLRRGWSGPVCLVLDRNWRCSEGELDIVATDPVGAERVVVFCEVKTRSGDGYGSPFDAVTQGKRRKLRRLGLLWLAQPHVRGFPADAVRRGRGAVASGWGADR